MRRRGGSGRGWDGLAGGLHGAHRGVGALHEIRRLVAVCQQGETSADLGSRF
ncbi:MAG: hypothetical protein QOD72_899, partial [Acidimicrobiaceae bacterium]|nr:hypothetical protein [Acidimicrobiaceae bacterium]